MKSGGDEGSHVITLTGYERNCQAAKEEIERMVKDLVSSDRALECHSKLGGGGVLVLPVSLYPPRSRKWKASIVMYTK